MKTIEPLTWETIPDPHFPCMCCEIATASLIAVITEGGRVIMSPLICETCAELDETEIKTRLLNG